MSDSFTVASWNVNSLRVRLPQVVQWLEARRPDVLAMQETKVVDEDFPRDAFESLGYHVVYSGQKTYNGVALASRTEPSEVCDALPGHDGDQKRFLAATIGGWRIVNVYVPNGESVDSDKYRYKLAWLETLRAHLQDALRAHPELIVLGDFNIAPEPRDVHDPAAWEGRVLFSEPERAAFRALLSTGLCDTFRLFHEEGGHYSWWDYRAAAFRRDLGLRIDHILASEPLCGRCSEGWIDREPRTWERPSDHTPVLARWNER